MNWNISRMHSWHFCKKSKLYIMELLIKDRLILQLDEVDSTNNYMRRILKEHPEESSLRDGSLIIADYQTSGRGQMGNGWHSDKGKNLLFSMLISPKELPANEQFVISRMASIAIKNMLDQFASDIRIKWPNDIYMEDKKIAGMLIENDVQGKNILHSIIGIGLNINQESFPDNLPNPVSLLQITGVEHDRDYLLDIFIREFFLLYREFQKGNIAEIEKEYMLDLYRVNDYYWFENSKGSFRAKIDRVLPSGHLILKTIGDDSERKYAFKEVSFID